MYALVEKKNHLAIHALFDTLHRAERHLAETVPVYVQKGFYTDKTLKADDFEIIYHVQNKGKRA